MEYKNKVVKCAGEKVKINYVKRCENEEGQWIFGYKMGGSCCRLFISTQDEDGKDLDPDTIELTLRHELFHMILDRLYFDEAGSETLVEWLATATRELHKQGLTI